MNYCLHVQFLLIPFFPCNYFKNPETRYDESIYFIYLLISLFTFTSFPVSHFIAEAVIN